MRKPSIILLLLMVAMSAIAGPVDKQQARAQAQAFLSTRGLQVAGEPRRAPGIASNDAQPLYVFNTSGDNGFVVIAGDDRSEAVLGYTEEGHYDEATLPENLRFWLELTALEIKSLPQDGPSTAASAPQRVATHSAISPLIKTKWNQGESTPNGRIYNTLTPTINKMHCVTGCVATAGAQIMYYYKYPKNATKPVPGYKSNDNVGTLPTLPAITFDWASMKEIYSVSDTSTQSEKAVSQLMQYCGYAAHMSYGLNGSSASPYTLGLAMSELFDYDANTFKWVRRSNYTIAGWDALIYGELKARRPVIISGDSSNGGHAFLCDGYNGAGLYHFNWGWGGKYNGYFKLHATNPYGGNRVYSDGTVNNGYVLNIDAFIGIQPNTGQGPQDSSDNDTWEEETIEGIVATAVYPSLDGTVMSAKLRNDNASAASLGFGVGELNANGTITVLDTSYEYYKNWELSSGSTWSSTLSFDASTLDLPEGKHSLVFISIGADDTQWQRCRPASLWYEATVANGQTTVVQHPVVNLKIDDFSCISSHQPGMSQKVAFKVTNMSDNFDGSLYLFVSTSASDKGSYRNSTSIKIKSGNTKERTISFTPSEAGLYYLSLSTDMEGNNVIAQTTVNIQNSLEALNFQFTGNKIATAVQPVVVTIKSKAGEYDQPLYLFASTSSSNKGSSLYATSTAIEAGKTEDVTFYFSPQSAGNYFIWICTDQGGTNVVGTATVTIQAVPDYQISLTKEDVKVDAGRTSKVTFTLKNGTSYDFHDYIFGYLFAGPNYDYVTEATSPITLIKAGETKDIVIEIPDLLPDTEYCFQMYYRKQVNYDFRYFTQAFFSFEDTSVGKLGDVNNDGDVNITDVMLVVGHIIGTSNTPINTANADMNGDQSIDVSDVMLIVRFILTGN